MWKVSESGDDTIFAVRGLELTDEEAERVVFNIDDE